MVNQMSDVFDVNTNAHYLFDEDYTPEMCLVDAYLKKYNRENEKYNVNLRQELTSQIQSKQEKFFKIYKLDSLTICKSI